ncbi:hypothetical protein BD410DRAFT_386366 [Rickenella mellea]|uniref:Uncharacterized protein n=1 Tax=Rickenella mellea TaxID=50990 RepID=A0A4Y7PXT4_9AGAM|nr:hypothetical protein BD410DRAFT_386366 [Rickenella mellea]
MRNAKKFHNHQLAAATKHWIRLQQHKSLTVKEFGRLIFSLRAVSETMILEYPHFAPVFSSLRLMADEPSKADDICFKVVLTGDSGVGKSNCEKYCS